jgi:uncharacterized protein (TIGR03382 family)
MKLKVLAAVALLALAAMPAFAYVSPGSFMTNDRGSRSKPGYGYSEVGENHPIDFDPVVVPLTQRPGGTSQPVPEPGTMAMASMGLMALGASLRRRMGR